MSDISPERNPDLLTEYSMSAEPTIRKILTTIEEDEHEVYMFVSGQAEHFVSEILSIDWARGVLWLATPYDKTLTPNYSSAARFTAVSFPEGVKIQFSGIGLLLAQYDGIEAICIAIPKSLVRLQRRHYFRVVADEELDSTVSFAIPGDIEPAGLVDISLAGCALLVRPLGMPPEIGQKLEDVRLQLPDGEGSMLVELEIRNIKPCSENPDLLQMGCEMHPLERGAERRLQKFLLATERRQRASLHAVD